MGCERTDKNIGALYLSNVATRLDLKDTQGSTQAYLKESSIFLKEDGSGAGTLQEVDMKV